MKKILQKSIVFLLVLTMIWSVSSMAMATTPQEVDAAIKDTAEYMYKTVKSPQVGSIGGEWAVISLARSGYNIPDEYYQKYYKTVEDYVKACKGELHDKKYTEYSRLIVALTAIGKDPSNVAGYNLLTALGDYDKTIWQGLNGPIWALISLDSGNYAMPQNPKAKKQATRDMYVQRILECQLPDGGWSLFGGTSAASSGDGVSDPDITGMALQALAKYQDKPEVKKACGEALNCMSKMQKSNGGFASWGSENSESCVQILVGLSEMGIPLDDSRFVKNGKTVLDSVMAYYVKGKGFFHTKVGDGSNQMASEQGLYALVAAQRAMTGKPSLYRMTDPLKIGANAVDIDGSGLPSKNKDVKTPKVSLVGKTFLDVQAHANQPAIEALAARQIINGKTDDKFDPNATMTRAEFATIVVKALGLNPKANNTFADVKSTDWFASFVGTANSSGIVTGISAKKFDPNGTITREEAATMVARAAKLCGMDTKYEAMAARDILSQFPDYVQISEWAKAPMAFCYDTKLLDASAKDVLPKLAIKRCEIAQILFNMLTNAKLL